MKDLTIQRAGRLVIDHFSADCRSGETLVVRGPNGAGKSTLLRAVCHLLPLEQGEIAFERWCEQETGSERLAKDGEFVGLEYRPSAYCHYVGHLDGVRPQLSVAETLDFWRALAGGRDVEGQESKGGRTNSCDDVLEVFGLAELRDVAGRYLSAGQKRRLALCRLLVDERPVWVLDEPLTSLDAQISQRVLGLIEDHVGNNGLALIAAHGDISFPQAKDVVLS